jgi:Toprim domain
MLAAAIERLVLELLPYGRREGPEWRVGSLGGEAGRSCAVHLRVPRAGIWSDFASGESGDALDLVAQVLFRGDRRDALAWSRSWLGLNALAPPAGQHRTPDCQKLVERDDSEERARRVGALKVFLAAKPKLAGTPAGLYLTERGIDFELLGRQPRSLRFHPNLWNSESRRAWPALVAAITDASGVHVATHRTWLAQREGRWAKAPLADPKMSLGRYAGGSIRLWRGASGAPLAKAPPGETAVIAEGIETALSVVVACPHMRVLAAVSLANMGRLALPPAVTCVVLAADNDAGNERAAAALQRAIDHFAAEGRTVKIALPETPRADWNDVLLEKSV